MELATGGGAVGKKRFKKLDVGSDDDGCIPVLARETMEILLVVFGAGFRLKLRVMLEDDFATEFLG